MTRREKRWVRTRIVIPRPDVPGRRHYRPKFPTRLPTGWHRRLLTLLSNTPQTMWCCSGSPVLFFAVVPFIVCRRRRVIFLRDGRSSHNICPFQQTAAGGVLGLTSTFGRLDGQMVCLGFIFSVSRRRVLYTPFTKTPTYLFGNPHLFCNMERRSRKNGDFPIHPRLFVACLLVARPFVVAKLPSPRIFVRV